MGWDVDNQVKKYWTISEKDLPKDLLDGLDSAFKEFQNVSMDNPGSASEFLSHLNLDFAKRFLRRLYKEKPIYPPEAMVKAYFFMDVKKMKFFTELERYLECHLEEAIALGFPEKDGDVLIPSCKTFWHFDRVRMADSWNTFFQLLRNSCVLEGRNRGVNIGQEVTEDATPIEARQNDKEAKYNGHYKKKGYKLDTVTDLDIKLPLSKEVIGINEDEAKCTIPHLKDMNADGITTKDIWVDGGYDDYPNLAWTGANGITVHHPIHENWVWNPLGEEDHIRKLNQKYWKCRGFRSDADLEYILAFLLKQGEVETVGAYFRNKAMAKWEEAPDGYDDNYHLRNRQEGNHGYWKEHLEIEDRMRVKGREKVDQYLTRNLCALLAVVLCRLQNGVTENLTSVVYFT